MWSELFPGNRHTVHCFQPAVLGTESSLELSPAQRKRTVWRMDGGAGSDAQLKWLLARDYHVIAKGMSHFRAARLASQAKRWDATDRGWVAEVPPPVDLGRPMRCFVQKQPNSKGKIVHSTIMSSLNLPSKGAFLDFYYQRGSAEIAQFREDKSGLALAARRKYSFTGQQGFLHLTDLTHNLLAHFYHRALIGSPFEGFGQKRILRDLLRVPGRLVFDQGKLMRVELLSQMNFAEDLIICLKRYISGG